MEFRGTAMSPGDVARVGEFATSKHCGLQSSQPLPGMALSGEFEGEDVEDRAHLVEVGDITGGELPDRRPGVGPVRHQTFRGQLLQSLADGDSGDSELGGEVAFDEPRTGPTVAFDDLIAQRLGDPHGLRLGALS